MNSERKAFCEYIKNEYNDDNPIEWLDGKPIKGLHLMLWNAWQGSANREGYKLVHKSIIADIHDMALDGKYLRDVDQSQEKFTEIHNLCKETMIGMTDDYN